MIINNELINEKFNKKLTPNRFKVVVSFLNIISTDESSGLVLYTDENFWKPFELIEEIKIKKLKAKVYNDLIIEFNKLADHSKKFIKKAKTSFFDTFDTSCEVNMEKELFELSLEDKDVILTKHIVCIIRELDNIERAFYKDGSICRVIPFNQIFQNVEDKEMESWLKYFFKNM